MGWTPVSFYCHSDETPRRGDESWETQKDTHWLIYKERAPLETRLILEQAHFSQLDSPRGVLSRTRTSPQALKWAQQYQFSLISGSPASTQNTPLTARSARNPIFSFPGNDKISGAVKESGGTWKQSLTPPLSPPSLAVVRAITQGLQARRNQLPAYQCSSGPPESRNNP